MEETTQIRIKKKLKARLVKQAKENRRNAEGELDVVLNSVLK